MPHPFMWLPVHFRLFQRSAVKSQSAPAVVFWFRFLKACVYYTFMNNEILAMFVGFVRVLRPLRCREFSAFPRFRCQLYTKSQSRILWLFHELRRPNFLAVCLCECVCGWIVIWHGIVGVDLLCEANISLKAHFLNHCFTKWYGALRALRHLKDLKFAFPFADIISSKDTSFIHKRSCKYYFHKVIARIRECSPYNSFRSRAKRVQ